MQRITDFGVAEEYVEQYSMQLERSEADPDKDQFTLMMSDELVRSLSFEAVRSMFFCPFLIIM